MRGQRLFVWRGQGDGDEIGFPDGARERLSLALDAIARGVGPVRRQHAHDFVGTRGSRYRVEPSGEVNRLSDREFRVSHDGPPLWLFPGPRPMRIAGLNKNPAHSELHAGSETTKALPLNPWSRRLASANLSGGFQVIRRGFAGLPIRD